MQGGILVKVLVWYNSGRREQLISLTEQMWAALRGKFSDDDVSQLK